MSQPPLPPRRRTPIRDRLRGIGYLLDDLAYAIGRGWSGVADRARAAWERLGRGAQVALAAGGCVVVVLLAVWLFVPSALPCGVPGGERCPEPDRAAELVPADSLAYAHVNLDPDTDQYREATAVAARVPLLTRQLLGVAALQLPGPGGSVPDLARDVAPWFGDEAAVAVVAARGRVPQQVVLLGVADPEGAAGYSESISAGDVRAQTYRGVELRKDSRGLTTALIDGFLAIGSEPAVRRIVDASTGADGGSLADDPLASEARDALPSDRFADAYVSQRGAGELLSEGSPLATLEPFVSAGATRGVAAAVTADEDGLSFAVRSALDPERARSAPGFFAAFESFEPEVAERLAPDTLAYLGIGDPGAAIGDLLSQASAEAPGIAAGFADLADRLRRLGQVDLETDLVPALGNEAALALEPAERGARASVAGSTPTVELIASGVDEARAREVMGRLQGPIADSVGGGASLQAPVFSEREVDGVTVRGVRISPTIDLAYAVFDSMLVVATSPTTVGRTVRGDGGLTDEERYERATDGLSEEPSLLVYLDLGRLLTLAERAGLAEDPSYAAAAPDLQRLEALGVTVSAGEESLATDARLLIREPPGGND